MKDYDSFIQNIIVTRGQWSIPEGEYYEKHHIKPSCIGGEGDYITKERRSFFKEHSHHINCIWLYPQEHFIAHKLLAIENPLDKRLVSAWMMMAYPKGKTLRDSIEITPEEYAEMRRLWSSLMSLDNPGLNKDGHPWNYGLTAESDARVAKYAKSISLSKKGVLLGSNSEQAKEHKKEAQQKRAKEHLESYIGANKDRVAISNGEEVRFIGKEEFLPEGFTYGNCKTRGSHDMSNYYANEEMQRHRHEITSGSNNPMFGKGYKVAGEKNGRYGKPVSQQTRDLISQKLKGKHYSAETNKLKGGPGVKKPEGFSEKCKKATAKNIYYIDGFQFYGKDDTVKYINNQYVYNISTYMLDKALQDENLMLTKYPNLYQKIIVKENLHEDS